MITGPQTHKGLCIRLPGVSTLFEVEGSRSVRGSGCEAVAHGGFACTDLRTDERGGGDG